MAVMPIETHLDREKREREKREKEREKRERGKQTEWER